MGSCQEIAKCPQEARVLCQPYNQGKSCWMNPEECRCVIQVGMSCEVCPIYKEHRRDLENLASLDFRKNRRKVKAFLKNMEPIFQEHIPNNGKKLKPVEKRRKKILREFTIKLLESEVNNRKQTLEKNLQELFRELF